MVNGNLVKNPIKTIFGSIQHGYSSDPYRLAGSGGARCVGGTCRTQVRDVCPYDRGTWAHGRPYNGDTGVCGWDVGGRTVRGYAAVSRGGLACLSVRTVHLNFFF